jgi:hypothetical protein
MDKKKKNFEGNENGRGDYLQVSHEVAEHVAHPLEELLSLLLLPPMPKEEINFSRSLFPHALQDTFFSPPRVTRASKHSPHFLHKNS